MRTGAVFIAALTLFGCTETANLQGAGTPGSGAGASAASEGTFPDLPIPNGAKMIVDRTLIVGTDKWYGQLALDASQGAVAIFDFYRTSLPQYGWQEITSVRAPVSVLTYDREDRILQMQIKGTTLRGSEILITVSPRGNPAPVSRGIPGPAPVTRIN